jgi:hypothetical protein
VALKKMEKRKVFGFVFNISNHEQTNIEATMPKAVISMLALPINKHVFSWLYIRGYMIRGDTARPATKSLHV